MDESEARSRKDAARGVSDPEDSLAIEEPPDLAEDSVGHDYIAATKVAVQYHERQAKWQGWRGVQRARLPLLVVVWGVMLALVVGIALGAFVVPLLPLPGAPARLPGRTTVTEAELDTPLGSYTYDGEVTQVTVRDAIEESGSLSAARNDDGTYNIPSVEAVLSAARNHFLLLDAESRGLSATDEEAVAYAQKIWGTNDLEVIAKNYGMEKNKVLEFMRNAATLRKLRDEVVTTKALEEPAAPPVPEVGMERYATEEYAAYILDLVGDEWDVNANWWAREEGPFRDQLINYSISNDAATYVAAQAAYFVARSQYAAVEEQIATEWATYANQILSEVTLELGTLVM